MSGEAGNAIGLAQLRRPYLGVASGRATDGPVLLAESRLGPVVDLARARLPRYGLQGLDSVAVETREAVLCRRRPQVLFGQLRSLGRRA